MKSLADYLLIFDLDGTLIDSAGDITHAINELLTTLQRPALPLAAVRDMVGEGAGRLVARVLEARPGPVVAPDSALQRFLSIYAAAPIRESRPYPGVEVTLKLLAAAGAVMALCTNKPSIPTLKVLQHLGLSDYFATVVAGDSLAVRKPDRGAIDPIIAAFGAGKRVLLIGDSETDSATAVAAGIPFALMTYGYRRLAPESIPANFRLDRFDALWEVLPLDPGPLPPPD